MLKGRTTIQLFNAKTGELEQEVHHDNMVTNAPSNIYILPYAFRTASSSADGSVTSQRNWDCVITNAATNLYESFFGGIMLFAEKNEESVDNMLPNVNNRMVGLAGSGTENNDLRCGERNATESHELENGYHFVWDFDTDKANGKISSVSLTNSQIDKLVVASNTNFAIGADMKTLESFSYYFNFDAQEPLKKCGETFTNYQLLCNVLKIYKSKDDKTFDVLLVYGDSNSRSTNFKGKWFLVKANYLMPNVRSITQGGGFTHLQSAEIISEGFGQAVSSSYKKVLGLDFVAEDGIINVVDFDYSAHKATHFVFREDGTKTDEQEVTMPAIEGVDWSKISTSYNNAQYPVTILYFDDYYHLYFLKYNSMDCVTFNRQGVISSNFTISGSNAFVNAKNIYREEGTKFVKLNIAGQSNTFTIRTLSQDEEIFVKSSYEGFIQNQTINCDNSIFGKKPFLIDDNIPTSQTTSSAKHRISIYLPQYFMSTINNLSTPVAKTDAQTMKIIYDLTEEAEE